MLHGSCSKLTQQQSWWTIFHTVIGAIKNLTKFTDVFVIEVWIHPHTNFDTQHKIKKVMRSHTTKWQFVKMVILTKQKCKLFNFHLYTVCSLQGKKYYLVLLVYCQLQNSLPFIHVLSLSQQFRFSCQITRNKNVWIGKCVKMCVTWHILRDAVTHIQPGK